MQMRSKFTQISTSAAQKLISKMLKNHRFSVHSTTFSTFRTRTSENVYSIPFWDYLRSFESNSRQSSYQNVKVISKNKCFCLLAIFGLLRIRCFGLETTRKPQQFAYIFQCPPQDGLVSNPAHIFQFD